MTSFVVVGNGYPARKIAQLIGAAPKARLAALFTDKPEDGFRPHHGAELMALSCLSTPSGVDWLRRSGADWLININSTTVIPEAILALFPARALNCHPGLLPAYAGLHVHQWAIRNGETEFGVTIHRMEKGIDTGPIVAETRFPIRPDDTGLSLFGRCLAAGNVLLAGVLERIVAGDTLPAIPQDPKGRRLYRHRDALDGRIDWRWRAVEIVNFVRAGNYEPFSSPSYVACLDPVADHRIEVLRAAAEEPTGLPPGTLVKLADGGAPVIACGDGNAVRLTRARRHGRVVGGEEWRTYFACLADRRLRGREA